MAKKQNISNNLPKVCSFAMPKTLSGKIDKRYKAPQFLKKDGTRDKRTILTKNRK